MKALGIVDTADARDEAAALRLLFHRLNNQLGIILAHAELLEAKATDDLHRARAAQVVTSVLDAMATARDIRAHAGVERPHENGASLL
jgi:pyruvoyl-dependent arginine decarboxylase (PvlArgDC)